MPTSSSLASELDDLPASAQQIVSTMTAVCFYAALAICVIVLALRLARTTRMRYMLWMWALAMLGMALLHTLMVTGRARLCVTSLAIETNSSVVTTAVKKSECSEAALLVVLPAALAALAAMFTPLVYHQWAWPPSAQATADKPPPSTSNAIVHGLAQAQPLPDQLLSLGVARHLHHALAPLCWAMFSLATLLDYRSVTLFGTVVGFAVLLQLFTLARNLSVAWSSHYRVPAARAEARGALTEQRIRDQRRAAVAAILYALVVLGYTTLWAVAPEHVRWARTATGVAVLLAVRTAVDVCCFMALPACLLINECTRNCCWWCCTDEPVPPPGALASQQDEL